MKKDIEKNIETTETEIMKNQQTSTPERRVPDEETIRKMATRLSDYNGSRSDNRNFTCLEVKDITLTGEDLSNIEAHYSKFENCTFEKVKFNGAEFHFAQLENCTFKNCELRNAEFFFAGLTKVNFLNCSLNGVELPFAHGEISCTGCMMSRCTARNANLHVVLKECDASYFDACFCSLEFDVFNSNLRRSEFNDAVAVKGEITRTDLTGAELNRSDLSGLTLTDCATEGLETENSTGLDDDLPSDLDELLDDEDE